MTGHHRPPDVRRPHRGNLAGRVGQGGNRRPGSPPVRTPVRWGSTSTAPFVSGRAFADCRCGRGTMLDASLGEGIGDPDRGCKSARPNARTPRITPAARHALCAMGSVVLEEARYHPPYSGFPLQPARAVPS